MCSLARKISQLISVLHLLRISFVPKCFARDEGILDSNLFSFAINYYVSNSPNMLCYPFRTERMNFEIRSGGTHLDLGVKCKRCHASSKRWRDDFSLASMCYPDWVDIMISCLIAYFCWIGLFWDVVWLTPSGEWIHDWIQCCVVWLSVYDRVRTPFLVNDENTSLVGCLSWM